MSNTPDPTQVQDTQVQKTQVQDTQVPTQVQDTQVPTQVQDTQVPTPVQDTQVQDTQVQATEWPDYTSSFGYLGLDTWSEEDGDVDLELPAFSLEVLVPKTKEVSKENSGEK